MNHQTAKRNALFQFLFHCGLPVFSEDKDFNLQKAWRDFEQNLLSPSLLSEGHKLYETISLILESKLKWEGCIQKYSKGWKLERISRVNYSILLLSFYELFQKSTPPKVIINEAVELAKKYGDKDSSSFINAVLDRYHKEESAL